MSHHPGQADLFRVPVFAAPPRNEHFDASLFRLRLTQAMSAALAGMNRASVAGDMGRLLGRPVSKFMLDAYTAPGRETHDISLLRFKVLARAVNAPSLWEAAIADDGLFLLTGDEPRLAEIARLQQAQRELAAQLKVLKAVPVCIRRS